MNSQSCFLLFFFASGAKKSENDTHQLPKAAHSVSLFEGVETTDDSSPVDSLESRMGP